MNTKRVIYLLVLMYSILPLSVMGMEMPCSQKTKKCKPPIQKLKGRRACHLCAESHKRCDGARPCSPCKKKGLGELCTDRGHYPPKQKPGRPWDFIESKVPNYTSGQHVNIIEASAWTIIKEDPSAAVNKRKREAEEKHEQKREEKKCRYASEQLAEDGTSISTSDLLDALEIQLEDLQREDPLTSNYEGINALAPSVCSDYQLKSENLEYAQQHDNFWSVQSACSDQVVLWEHIYGQGPNGNSTYVPTDDGVQQNPTQDQSEWNLW